tara:strand:+ start:205 stop:1059 length:855 start_codon:yes stop_codon:yes gene_type:complete
MDKLKIKFVDFWPGFNPSTDPLFGEFLNRHFNVEYSNNPDVVIFSVFGTSHKYFTKKNVIKIFYAAENFPFRPYPALDMVKGWDKVIEFSHYSITPFNVDYPTNFRMPQYLRKYGFKVKDEIDNTREKYIKPKDIVYLQRSCVSFRDDMVKDLMKKFRVDCVGNCLRNKNVTVGEDKLGFIKNYNFVIAIENSCSPGYTSEKIIDPFKVNSIPIYFGDSEITKDFNGNTFLNYHTQTKEEIYDQISMLLNNKDKLLEMMSYEKIKNHSLYDGDIFLKFFKNCLR